MPGKYKSKYGDEYESDDFEATDTLIGRNRVPSSQAKKKSRPASASAKKKSPRRPVTPGKKKKRPQSAPSARTGHDLWMNAVKQRLTGFSMLNLLYGKAHKRNKNIMKSKRVGLASNRHPTSPRHKTVSEYWIDTLRKTGTGFTTESTGMNTFSGKRPRDKDMPYLSTPAYLRQMAGTERPPKSNDPMSKASPGTPAYKSQEEYYEQILEYKKQVGALNQDSNNMKAKIRRLEEDNLKKEKEIDSLLNPQKSEELRRTLTDKRPDSGSVIHSLKQKILKLETQMRDKETSYIKLQSDMKTTKVEEMKQQMEVFYNEIVRLQHSKDTGMDKSARPTSREGGVKIKALNETILRLNKSNEQLQSENRSLKEDLKNAMDDHGGRSHASKTNSPRKIYTIPGLKKDYEDMDRKELLRSITQLEKRLEKAERHMEGSSIVSYESKAAQVQGKIALDGSLEDRLDQLDKRESELLEMLDKKNEKIKVLTAEKNRWKKRCEEMEKLIGSGNGEYDYRMDERTEKASRSSRPPSARTTSTRGQRPTSARSDDRPPTAKDRTPRGRPERPDSGRTEKRPVSAKRRPSLESSMSASRKQKIRDFQENRSAKTIQRHWKSHRQDQQKKDNDEKTKDQEKIFRHTELQKQAVHNQESHQSPLGQSLNLKHTNGKSPYEGHLPLRHSHKPEHTNEKSPHDEHLGSPLRHSIRLDNTHEKSPHEEHLSSPFRHSSKLDHTHEKSPHEEHLGSSFRHSSKLDHTHEKSPHEEHLSSPFRHSSKLDHTHDKSPHEEHLGSSLRHSSKLDHTHEKSQNGEHFASVLAKSEKLEHGSGHGLREVRVAVSLQQSPKTNQNSGKSSNEEHLSDDSLKIEDSASELIRSALMGHTTRRQQMAMYDDDTEDDYMTDNEEYNECVNLIQSSLLGHQQRKTRMRDFHLSSTGEEDDDDDDTDIIESPKRRLSSSYRSNRPPSPSIHRSRPQSGKSRSSISSASGKGSSAYNSSYRARANYSTHLDDDDDF
ncbi:golgin subfamily A member 6-like protein 22 isoform X2 [Mercenaria mercenaria]|uniref:golgin subfamily A member 6-like protein 22 isoform X2 n=1 Tax=Mercenaria mercenaria TaxID=6596 RepID=UPI00234EC4DC|nr:golgin subfamily A member 6-like protein 22 isoform X2 [Mercenaria mercenaria]